MSRTVLLIEDQVALRRVVREVLEEYGYAVIEAPAGRRSAWFCRNVAAATTASWETRSASVG